MSKQVSSSSSPAWVGRLYMDFFASDVQIANNSSNNLLGNRILLMFGGHINILYVFYLYEI